MPATMTTVDAITKEVYQGKIRNQLQEEAVGYRRIEQTSEGVESQVGGKYVTFPIRIRRNHGIGYRDELEQLQDSGQQKYASVRVGLAYGYGRVKLSGQTMELAESNYQAFASAMDLEMDGLKNDIQKDVNRIFYGNGQGTLATLTADGANTVTVDTVQYLELDMQIDIIDSDGTTVNASNRKITAINESTKVVTYDGADVSATTAAGDYLVRTGNNGREPQGLGSIVSDTGSLFNVDPSTEPLWAATVDDNAGVNRALSEGLMIQNVDAVRRKGGKTSLILTGLGVRRAYFNLLSQQRRYPSTTEFEGGFRGLAFSAGREIPVVEDVDAPDNTMYGLDESSFKVYRDSPWSWMQRDGSIWKWVVNYDAYEAILRQYWELGVNRRNANWVLQDITEG